MHMSSREQRQSVPEASLTPPRSIFLVGFLLLSWRFNQALSRPHRDIMSRFCTAGRAHISLVAASDEFMHGVKPVADVGKQCADCISEASVHAGCAEAWVSLQSRGPNAPELARLSDAWCQRDRSIAEA